MLAGLIKILKLMNVRCLMTRFCHAVTLRMHVYVTAIQQLQNGSGSGSREGGYSFGVETLLNIGSAS